MGCDKMKKIYLLGIALIMLLLSISVVSAGLFDGLFGEEQQDNVIEIENITFNTTNVTKFELYNESDGYKWYVDENKTGYNIQIIDFNEYYGMAMTPENENAPSETVNGIVVYTKTANTGDHIGEPRYVSYVINKDLNKEITIWSPDPNETAKIALSLKFNEK